MMNPKIGIFAFVIAVAASAPVMAAIMGMQSLRLDFTKPTVAQKVSWTKSEKLKLRPDGLVYEAPGPDSLVFALETTQPFATGLSWRPARAVSIRATLSPGASTIKLNNGQTYTPAPGKMFVRYSPNAKHWSTWQVLTTATEAAAYKFSGNLEVAQQDAAEYDELLAKYSTLDVPWKSDEEACVQWILKTQPDFFTRHLPFIGYVQFLYEANLAGGQRIEHLDFDIGYGIGGLHAPPKDPKTADNRDTPWRFRAP